MNYINRTLENKFLLQSAVSKAVMVTGARHVGKTAMLRHLSEGQGRTYVSLDDMMVRNLAKTDPALFFQTYSTPIIIDEIQYAPELFLQIKAMCDESEETGRFWLTCSQRHKMMSAVQEILAESLSVLHLYSLSRSELEGISYDMDLDFGLPCLLERQKKAPASDLVKTFACIWRGGMPKVVHADREEAEEYYESYVDGYIMRDITQIGGITDALKFRKFITACAAMISSQVNYKILAEASDISQPTAKEWLNLLEGLDIVYLLKPYANRSIKRLSKTPKLYFHDTGLCAYLSRWLTHDTLRNGAAAAQYYECYVVSEMIKSYAYSDADVRMHHFRDAKARKIDVLVECNDVIHPLEIKLSANPDSKEIRKYSAIDKGGVERGTGGILCLCRDVVPIDERNCFIPSFLI